MKQTTNRQIKKDKDDGSNVSLSYMKKTKIILNIMLMMFFMTGIWLIDLGSSMLAVQRVINIPLVAQSLTITATPNQVYHIGLILCGLCFFLLSVLFVFEVLKEDDD